MNPTWKSVQLWELTEAGQSALSRLRNGSIDSLCVCVAVIDEVLVVFVSHLHASRSALLKFLIEKHYRGKTAAWSSRAILYYVPECQSITCINQDLTPQMLETLEQKITQYLTVNHFHVLNR